jgi:peptidoglycan/LPS O-acetylase OafA/YrhL
MQAYRADIDGLRAVSVLSVVAFHAGLGLSGGFVGVDIFFVISGYLITRLIVSELESGTFSLSRFWERRIRRIWPASLAVLAASLAVGWFVMLPKDYSDLAGDVISQVLMVANVRFWRGTDYFAQVSETRVLLHTWSLAVEEQFYVLFPLALMALWRFRSWLPASFALLILAGAALSQAALGNDAMAAFFLLPFRAWELLIGSILAIAPVPAATAPWRSTVVATLGLMLIVIPCITFSTLTPFPGLAAAAPCAGAALIMREGSRQNRNAVSIVLSLGPVRAIGLMSYSIYLWHWPVFAFTRYCLGIQLTGVATAAALLATAVTSFLSWRHIETPLRRPKVQGKGLRPVLVLALGCSTCIAGLALLVRWSEGVPLRLDPEVVSVGTPRDVCRRWESRRPPRPDLAATPMMGVQQDGTDPCFLFWGDSHAMAISEVLDERARAMGMSGLGELRPGCIPLPGVWRPHWPGLSEQESDAVGQEICDWIRRARPRFVVVCARWSQYLEDPASLVARVGSVNDGSGEAQAAVAFGFAQLREACRSVDAGLVVLLEVPTQDATPQQRAVQASLAGTKPGPRGITREEHDRSKGPSNRQIVSAAGPSATVVDLAEPFFDESGTSITTAEGISWYSDDDHINSDGARAVLQQTIDQLLRTYAEACR